MDAMLDTALEVTVGTGVSFRLSVVNAGDSPIELMFIDACRADFAVFDGAVEVWRYSDERTVERTLTNADLQPGETADFDRRWADPVPGDYTAEATLSVRERHVSARTPFSV